MLAVDGGGRAHDGDELIALAARGMAARGELGGGVAVTVMSNYGFHRAMEEAGIEVAVTQVGDRYVLDELRERGWALGGEQSGHIIDTRFVATGDGIAAALATMRELAGRDLADGGADGEAAADPGQRRGRRARGDRRRRPRSGRRSSARATALEGRGRVLLRPSGTEPLVRVMVEAPERRGGGRGLRAACRVGPPRARPERRRPLPLIAFYVRNRRICGRSSLPRPPGRRAREARIPRL